MERPHIKIRLIALDYIIEIAALLSVLAAITLYIIYWIKAPNVVPIHYNIYGEVDGYGSKTALITEPSFKCFNVYWTHDFKQISAYF